MLTVTVQGCFASVQSQGVIAASQAQMMDASVLSYGLCFTHKSNPAYGIPASYMASSIGASRFRAWTWASGTCGTFVE